MRKRIALALLLLCIPIAAVADGLSSIANARAVADATMEKFGLEEFERGYESLKPYWPLPIVEIDNLSNQTRTQWPLVQQRFGKSLGTEFIKEEKVGEAFVRFTYIQKFERHAVRWLFVFYKPKSEWLINGVTFDDQIGRLF